GVELDPPRDRNAELRAERDVFVAELVAQMRPEVQSPGLRLGQRRGDGDQRQRDHSRLQSRSHTATSLSLRTPGRSAPVALDPVPGMAVVLPAARLPLVVPPPLVHLLPATGHPDEVGATPAPIPVNPD